MKKTIGNGIYKQMETLASITIALIGNGKMNRAKKCLDAVEKLYLNGSSQTRSAIANVYVYHISTIFFLHHLDVAKLLPPTLRAEYIKQINAF